MVRNSPSDRNAGQDTEQKCTGCCDHWDNLLVPVDDHGNFVATENDDEDSSQTQGKDLLEGVINVPEKENEDIILGYFAFKRPQQRVIPVQGQTPHQVENLVGEDAYSDCKNSGISPELKNDKAECEHQDGGKKGMGVNPPVTDCYGKKNITDRFIDQIGKHCTNRTGYKPSLILQKIAEKESEDDSGEQVEEKKHGSAEIYMPFFGKKISVFKKSPGLKIPGCIIYRYLLSFLTPE